MLIYVVTTNMHACGFLTSLVVTTLSLPSHPHLHPPVSAYTPTTLPPLSPPTTHPSTPFVSVYTPTPLPRLHTHPPLYSLCLCLHTHPSTLFDSAYTLTPLPSSSLPTHPPLYPLCLHLHTHPSCIPSVSTNTFIYRDEAIMLTFPPKY